MFSFRRIATIVTLAQVMILCRPAPVAAAIYLNVPGITGENSTPGYPGAMSISQLDVSPNAFAVQRTIDSASPQIQSAVVMGTVFSLGSALFYNGAATGSPDAILDFQKVIASSQVFGPGTQERDVFSAATPSSIYLEVSGIAGESNTPGHAGVMKIDSLTMSGTSFTIDRKTDSASPQLQSAVILGTLHAAKLLFYNSPPTGAPDGELDFANVIVSSYTPISGGNELRESVSFNYETISQPQAVPEPTSLAFGLLGALFIGARISRLMRKTAPKE